MKTDFNPETDQLALRYDPETRNLLRRIAPPIQRFLEGDVVATHCHRAQRDDLNEGQRVLEQLAGGVSAQVTSLEVYCAFELVSLASCHLAQDRASAQSFSRAVMFLADATPARLPPLSLPPAKDVFKRKAVPREIRRLYENLCSRTGPHQTYLSIRQMSRLWRHLQGLTHRGEAMEVLVWCLGLNTLCFHATITKLNLRKRTGSSSRQGKGQS